MQILINLNQEVKAEKYKINIPILQNYDSYLDECLISPNGQFVAITLSLQPIVKPKQGMINVQLYNVVNGEELFSNLWDRENSLISIKFSHDSSMFIMLEMENLIIIQISEKIKKSIIKFNCQRLLSIDIEKNISILSSDNYINIFSSKNDLIRQLVFDMDIDYIQLLGMNYAIYNCGQIEYIVNILNKKVLRRWKNQDQEIIDQINYKNFLLVQLFSFNIKQIYIRSLKSGKIIRKYQNSNYNYVQNRVAYEKSSIKTYNFKQIRIKKPIQNPTKNAFEIQLNVNIFDLLRGRFNQYNFKINEDYNRSKEFPIYLLKENLLQYYLFSIE